MRFDGFGDTTKLIGIPEVFFGEILPVIDDIDELRILAFIFWRLGTQEGLVKFVFMDDIQWDPKIIPCFGSGYEKRIREAIRKAVHRGVLLDINIEGRGSILMLNTPRGQAVSEAVKKGKWSPESTDQVDTILDAIRPNLFYVYEENIGPLSPMIAETLKDAQEMYPVEMIEEAMLVAVKNNVRRWNYIEAILKSWEKEGRYESYRRSSAEDREKYVRGELSDFIEH